MDWLFFGEISLAGLAMGGLYALIALGFVRACKPNCVTAHD